MRDVSHDLKTVIAVSLALNLGGRVPSRLKLLFHDSEHTLLGLTHSLLQLLERGDGWLHEVCSQIVDEGKKSDC